MNTSKFFNRKSSIRNPQKPYKKGYVKEESKNYKSRIFSRAKETKTNKTLLSIRSNVFRIENLLRGKDALESKSEKAIQKYKLFELKQEQEKKKKINAQSGGGGGFGLGNLIQRPKTGIMDAISNFLFYTFLGWLFTTLQPLIPKLEALAPILGGAFDFLSGTLKFLMDSIGSFIKFGYDAKDTITKKHEEIKVETEKLKENFDNTLDELKKVIGESIEAVSSFLGITYGEDKVNTTLEQQYAEDLKIPDLPPLPSSSLPLQKPQLNQPNFGPIKGVRTGGIIGYADGGNVEEENESQNKRIDPRKDPITRGIQQEKEKKKLLLFPTQKEALKTNPGADVGGEIYIKSLYGESISDRQSQSGQSNPVTLYSSLLKISEDYKKPDTSKDFIGFNVLLGAVNDVILGQKPSNKVYEQFASGLNYLIDFAKNDPKEFEKINLEQMVKNAIEPKLLAALSNISLQVSNRAIQYARQNRLPSGLPNIQDVTGETAEERAWLKLIRKSEGTSGADGYGKVFGGIVVPELAEGKLTIEEAAKMAETGKLPSRLGGKTVAYGSYQGRISGATGAYQFMPGSLRSAARVAGIDLNTPMTPEIQDKLALAWLVQGGIDPKKRATEADIRKAGQRWGWAGIHGEATKQTSQTVPQAFEIYNQYYEQESSVQEFSGPNNTPSQGFRTGLKTGPAERIGSGTAYHVDARIIPELPLKDKVAMIDSMAAAHAQEGYVMEFSGRGVAGTRWNINLSQREKEELAKKVLASHHSPRKGWQPFDYFIVKSSAKDRWDKSAEGSTIMAPKIPGGTYEYQEGGGYGRFLIIRDKNGKEIFRVGHGDVGVPSPKEIGKRFKIDELTKKEKEKDKSKSPQSNQPKKTPSFSRLTSKEAQELMMRSEFMKPGDSPIVVEGIGSIQMGKDFFGRPQKKYYNRDGKEITKDQFNELMKKYKNPIRSNTPKKKYGGLVYKPGTSPVLPEEKYASYEDPMERGIVAIQPIYISQPVPVPVGGSGGGGVIAFSLPKVNNMDNYQQLMRG